MFVKICLLGASSLGEGRGGESTKFIFCHLSAGGRGLGSEADSDKWRFRTSRRMEQFFIPSLIVNQGNTCYIGCSLVLVNR